MKLTITIDPARVEQFGDLAETLQDFVRRVAADARTGGRVVWTTNAANVGTVDRIDYDQAAPIAREATPAQREALRRIGQARRKTAAPLDDFTLGLIEESALAQADYLPNGDLEWTPDRAGMPGHTTYTVSPDGHVSTGMIA